MIYYRGEWETCQCSVCLFLLCFFRMAYFAKFKLLSGNSIFLYYSNVFHIENRHLKKPPPNSYVTLFTGNTSWFCSKVQNVLSSSYVVYKRNERIFYAKSFFYLVSRCATTGKLAYSIRVILVPNDRDHGFMIISSYPFF